MEEIDGELPADGAVGPVVMAALSRQTEALTRLLEGRSRGSELDPNLPGGPEEGGAYGPTSAVCGSAQRSRYRRMLQETPGHFSRRVQQNMAAALGPRHRNELPDPLIYYERYGSFEGVRTLVLISYQVAYLLDAFWSQDYDRASDRAALLAVCLDQAVLDGGRWDLAWLLSITEDPPPSVMHRRPERSNSHAYSLLADEAWTTSALAYLREMDAMVTRRHELGSGTGSNGAGRGRGHGGAQPLAGADPVLEPAAQEADTGVATLPAAGAAARRTEEQHSPGRTAPGRRRESPPLGSPNGACARLAGCCEARRHLHATLHAPSLQPRNRSRAPRLPSSRCPCPTPRSTGLGIILAEALVARALVAGSAVGSSGCAQCSSV